MSLQLSMLKPGRYAVVDDGQRNCTTWTLVINFVHELIMN